MEEVIYRRAGLDDVDAIVALRESEQNHESDNSEPLYYITSGIGVVAEIDGRIIGFRYGKRMTGDIFVGALFLVHHEYRDKGIGTNLSEFMFDELRRLGFRVAVTGNSDYYPPVVGAIEDGVWHRPTDLYLRLGYNLVAETELSRLFIKEL